MREYRRAPRASVYMARAFLFPRRPGLRAGLPELQAVWRGHRVDGTPLADFLALAGLEGHPLWPLLYPQAAGFRLLMSFVTDYRFPLPIWGALQVRNRLALRAPYARGDVLDLDVRIADARALDKGTEIDVACAARRGGTLVWEGVTTFYYRGRRSLVPPGAPPPSPAAEGPAVAQWTPEAGARLRFARLTGDYNPMHWSNAYARRFGFRGAFHHAQRMLGQCLARLPRREGSTLEAWFKGPVYYGAKVSLRAANSDFGLCVQGDARPAILGRLS
jgi:hypothetical protein